jgi:hypothetical protein
LIRALAIEASQKDIGEYRLPAARTFRISRTKKPASAGLVAKLSRYKLR